jgi:hypothetical protein
MEGVGFSSMSKIIIGGLILGLAAGRLAFGQNLPKAEPNPPITDGSAVQEAKRQTALAEYTRRMKEANYPVLFEEAAKEFNVPADILKAVAFAETRWDHLTWPPGETESPETGMPRPYGIMSLWDNRFFGHSLVEAARLLGESPETLKQDPLQNMRGGAALLRKLYDEIPKPSDTSEADIESWRNAIRKYCGIPEPDLAASHVLDVYIYMSRGYHQYSIEWDARPVNLGAIRDEAKRMASEERARRQPQTIAVADNSGSLSESLTNTPPAQTNEQPENTNPISESDTNSPPVISEPSGPSRRRIIWFIVGALAALGGLWWYSGQSKR